jgi:hypothetical protein
LKTVLFKTNEWTNKQTKKLTISLTNRV